MASTCRPCPPPPSQQLSKGPLPESAQHERALPSHCRCLRHCHGVYYAPRDTATTTTTATITTTAAAHPPITHHLPQAETHRGPCTHPHAAQGSIGSPARRLAQCPQTAAARSRRALSSVSARSSPPFSLLPLSLLVYRVHLSIHKVGAMRTQGDGPSPLKSTW